jgi:hypothetical protein
MGSVSGMDITEKTRSLSHAGNRTLILRLPVPESNLYTDLVQRYHLLFAVILVYLWKRAHVCLFFYKFSHCYNYFILIWHDGGGPIGGSFKHLELPKVSEAPKIHFFSY